VFEVTCTATVTTKIKDRTVFLVECKQAGIFEVRNIPDEQMQGVLSVACPQIIYPYLRGNVADVITRAGFPPVHLAEINFQSMYEQQLAAQEQAQDATAQ
jgi:preprotein translocase subunit SecB